MPKAANTLPRTPSSCKTRPSPAVKTAGNFSFKGECNTIQFIDMFAGIGGFREGLTRAGGFTCVGHCECDKYAEHSYRALFDCKGEWYTEDARNADPDTMPDFDLLCGGFPCQAFSLAGNRRGFGDPRGTLFFELARLAEARKPRYLLFENVPGLLNHDQGRTFAAILDALDRLGYHVEWQVLNSQDFGVAQSRRRVYIVGFLDERCAGKILPFTGTTKTPAARRLGEGFPVKEATKTGYKLAYPGDSISLAYATTNRRRGRVGHGIAHTLTTGGNMGVLEAPCPVRTPLVSTPWRNPRRMRGPNDSMFTLTTKDRHGVFFAGHIRRLTPRECLRLQGWQDDRIDKILAVTSEGQAYKQAGNGVTVNVVEAIGRRLAAVDAELNGGTAPAS